VHGTGSDLAEGGQLNGNSFKEAAAQVTRDRLCSCHDGSELIVGEAEEGRRHAGGGVGGAGGEVAASR
jgi:hypothetical protein